MSLGFGSGPLGAHRGTWSFPVPEHAWYLEEWPRRMRAIFAGETLVDTRRAKLLHASGAMPVHWFPIDDVRRDLLAPADQPDDQGDRFDVRVGQRVAPHAVRWPPANHSDGPPVEDHVSIEFGAMDRWFEEDEPIYAHSRDPYHRVDVRASSVPVVVSWGTTVVARSSRPKLLFETGVPVRHYLPFADVRLDLLERSATVSECPYKGDGQHWHLVDGDQRLPDAAWSLPHPLPEGLSAAEHVCFYPSKVNVRVDSEPLVEPE